MAAPLNPLSFPEINLSLIYDLLIVMVLRSGSSYSTEWTKASAPDYSCLLTDRASLISLSSLFLWKERKEEVKV
jgi:hypothetical protein